MDLRHNNKDFRDLLPFLHTSKFKHPIVPAAIWKSLGLDYDLRQWNRVFKKYRASIVEIEEDFNAVSAEYDEDTERITLFVSQPLKFERCLLKFQIIQTLLHEIIHAHQYYCHDSQYERQYNSTKENDGEYLGKFGEIQAFAHDIALEFFEIGNFENTETYERYKPCEPAVRRALWNQVFRWVNKYKV